MPDGTDDFRGPAGLGRSTPNGLLTPARGRGLIQASWRRLARVTIQLLGNVVWLSRHCHNFTFPLQFLSFFNCVVFQFEEDTRFANGYTYMASRFLC